MHLKHPLKWVLSIDETSILPDENSRKYNSSWVRKSILLSSVHDYEVKNILLLTIHY